MMLAHVLPLVPALLGTLIRSFGIAGGAAVAASAELSAPVSGVITSGDVQAIGGALVALISAIWGVVEKLNRGHHG